MKEPWIKHPIILSGRFVELIPLQESHLDDLFSAASDKTLWEHVPIDGTQYSRFMQVYRLALADRDTGTQYPFVIVHKATGEIVGSTRLFEIYPADRKLEIGWTWIVREYWGTIINIECKFLLLRYCFEVLGACRVQIKTDELNIRSRKAIEKIGGRFEGILRKDRIKDNGISRNAAYYSILDHEWVQVNVHLESLLVTYS